MAQLWKTIYGFPNTESSKPRAHKPHTKTICLMLKILYAVLACNISRSFADHSSKILISKVDKFYTGFTMIIQKNRHVNFGLKFNTFHN